MTDGSAAPEPASVKRAKRLGLINRRRVLAIYALAVVVATGLFLWAVPRDVLFAVSARVETLTFRVVNEEAASFGLLRARLREAGGALSCVENVTVSPTRDSEVQYVRFGHDRATVIVQNGAVEIRNANEDQAARRYESPVVFVIDDTVKDCLSPKVVRLPTNGQLVSVGEQTSFSLKATDPMRVLLSGEVRMMIRAFTFPGQSNLAMLGVPQPGDVSVADSVRIPAGAAILGSRDSGGKVPDWWGFADLDFNDTFSRGFEAELSTHAGEIDILLPTPVGSEGGGSQERLNVSLSLLERCVFDPMIRYAAAVFALVIATIEVFLRFLDLKEKVRS